MLLLFTGGSGSGPAAASYPLNDDGTVAALFGSAWLETDAPAYWNADYTYTGAATGGAAVAFPDATNVFGSQAITVGAGEILACECVINSAPGGNYEDIGLVVIFSSGGTPYGTANLYIRRLAGVDTWRGSGMLADLARPTAAAGFRLGVEIHGDGGAGSVVFRTTDGTVVSSVTFTTGTEVTFGLNAVDGGTTAAGQTASITLVPVGADMQLGYSAGTTDFNGDACPQTAAVWNPYFSNARVGFSNANLRASLLENANWSNFGSTGVILAGEKKCFGIIVGTAGNTMIGFGNSSASVIDNQFLGFTADAVGFFNAGQVYWNGSGSTYTPSWTSGDFILLAINRVDDEVTLYKNGVAAATISIPAVTGDLIPMASFEGSTGRYIDGYFDPGTFPNAAPTGYTGVTT